MGSSGDAVAVDCPHCFETGWYDRDQEDKIVVCQACTYKYKLPCSGGEMKSGKMREEEDFRDEDGLEDGKERPMNKGQNDSDADDEADGRSRKDKIYGSGKGTWEHSLKDCCGSMWSRSSRAAGEFMKDEVAGG